MPLKSCLNFNRGKCRVCGTGGRITGFAIADLKAENIWALFVDPDFEKTGRRETGMHGTKELKFEMTADDWYRLSKK